MEYMWAESRISEQISRVIPNFPVKTRCIPKDPLITLFNQRAGLSWFLILDSEVRGLIPKPGDFCPR